MNKQLKKMFLLSSLGSLLVGAGVALARKKGKTGQTASQSRSIPADCARILILTEAMEMQDQKGLRRERYLLQRTPFKVWSVLDLPANPGIENPEGAAVYHVTWSEILEIPGETAPREIEKARFYGTLGTAAPGATIKKNLIARGWILHINKCYVGGAANGVETGDQHRSAAPILNYRFEYAEEKSRGMGGRES
jgi:hypothetical protein